MYRYQTWKAGGPAGWLAGLAGWLLIIDRPGGRGARAAAPAADSLVIHCANAYKTPP